MPTTSLSHILHNQETRDNTVYYIFHSQLKKMLLNFSDYLISNCSLLVVTCHAHLFIIINHSLSIIAENTSKHSKLSIIQKTLIIPQEAINWWLKYWFFLISSKTAGIIKKKVRNNLLFYAWSSQPTFSSQLIFYRAAGKTCSLNRFGLHYLFYTIFLVICSVIKFRNLVKFLSWHFECTVPFFVWPFVTGSDHFSCNTKVRHYHYCARDVVWLLVHHFSCNTKVRYYNCCARNDVAAVIPF